MTTDSWLFAISLAWCAIVVMAVLFLAFRNLMPIS